MDKLKKLIAWFKHIVKDPVRTMKEANKRQEELMPLLYISAGLLVAPLILAAVLSKLIDLSGILTPIAFIGFIGLALSGFLFLALQKIKIKFATLTCDGCNTMLTLTTKEAFEQYVTYKINSETPNITVKPIGNVGSDGTYAEVKATGNSTVIVDVTFTCPNCGKTKSFKYKITPIKFEIAQKKVPAGNLEQVQEALEAQINAVFSQYRADEKSVPYTIQSIHHPDYENRGKPQLSLGPVLNGVTIRYHRTVDELVEGFFIHNEANGTVSKY